MRIKRIAGDRFAVKLPEAERELLLGLAAQLRELLIAEDAPALERLFPPAYANDEERESEYRALVHDELLEKRLVALDVIEQTANQTELAESEIEAWMSSINSVRLVLGTILDVSEDMDLIDDDDPRAGSYAVYGYLTHLLGLIVHALSEP